MLVVNCDAYAKLALSHAEGTAQLYLIAQLVFCDKILELFYDLTGTLEMAGAAYANCNFHF